MKKVIYSVAVLTTLIGCGESTPERKNPAELIGQDAVQWLAGDEKRAWKLVDGHSIYDYLLFDNEGGAVVFSMDPPIPYKVVGTDITFTEETGYQAFFRIQQLSDDTLVLLRLVDTAESDAVIEPLTYVNLETFRSKGMKLPDDVWLKGDKGTVWQSDDDTKYTFNFMNDGKLIRTSTGKEEGTWTLEKGADASKGNYSVEIFSSDYIKLQWRDSVLEMHYAGQAK